MAEREPVCPGCDRADETMTVRAGYRDGAGTPGGPPAAALAPPPAVGPPPERDPSRGYALLAGLGGLGVVVALTGIAADGLSSLASSPYLLGSAFGELLVPVVLFSLFGTRYALVAIRHREKVAAHRRETGYQRRRAAVWEAALLCRRCTVTFFPGGVLRADIPASPAIALERFPVMVATMADRAHGGVAPPDGADAAATRAI